MDFLIVFGDILKKIFVESVSLSNFWLRNFD